jgi:RecB family exonuclease
MRISYSAIDTFQNCPLKYKYQEIDKIRTPKGSEAVFGTAVHESLRFFHSQEPRIVTEQQLLDFFREKWESTKNSAVWSDESLKGLWYNEGVRILKDYAKKNDPAKTHILGLETFFEIAIDDEKNAEKHILVGKIDRMDNIGEESIEVVDYKTAKKMPSQKEVDENLQLSLYALGVMNRWPNFKSPNIKLSLYFLKHGMKISTYRSVKEIEATKQMVLDRIAEIKSSDFRPTPNPLCDWCGYKKICPMFRHLYREEAKKEDDINIASVIKRYFEIKQNEKKNKAEILELADKINEYCDKSGLERLFDEDFYITRSLKTTWQYDPSKVKEILSPVNLLGEVMDVDQKKIKGLLKVLPLELRNELEKSKVKKSESRSLNIKKTKPGAEEEDEEEE